MSLFSTRAAVDVSLCSYGYITSYSVSTTIIADPYPSGSFSSQNSTGGARIQPPTRTNPASQPELWRGAVRVNYTVTGPGGSDSGSRMVYFDNRAPHPHTICSSLDPCRITRWNATHTIPYLVDGGSTPFPVNSLDPDDITSNLRFEVQDAVDGTWGTGPARVRTEIPAGEIGGTASVDGVNLTLNQETSRMSGTHSVPVRIIDPENAVGATGYVWMAWQRLRPI